MAWAEFETKNARYRLVLVPWVAPMLRKNLEANLKKSDALIPTGYLPEGRGVDYLENYGRTNFGVKVAIAFARENKMDVWVVEPRMTSLDIVAHMLKHGAGLGLTGGGLMQGHAELDRIVGGNKRISRRDYLKLTGLASALLLGFAITPFEVVGLGGEGKMGAIRGALRRSLSEKERHLLPLHIIEFRNAVTAEKAESIVAPTLRRELGRKPEILIVNATPHAGVKELILNPRPRAKSLKVFDNPALRLFVDLKTLGELRRARPTKTGFKIESMRVPFPMKQAGRRATTSARRLGRKEFLDPLRKKLYKRRPRA